MITNFRVKNYKALRDVSVDLTQLHVLIGPNDSGKTSLLEAIEAYSRSATAPMPQIFGTEGSLRRLVWQGSTNDLISFEARIAPSETRAPFEYGFIVAFRENPSVEREWMTSPPGSTPVNLPAAGAATSVWTVLHSHANGLSTSDAHAIAEEIAGVHYYRWNPQLMALPAAPDSTRRNRMYPSGFGLALLLDDILGHDRDRFSLLESKFRQIFPDVAAIRLVTEMAYRTSQQADLVPMLGRADGKGIHIAFRNGLDVPASELSDGMLYVLAYLSLLYNPEPPRFLLLEEPENGIHPRRINDLIGILRELIEQQEHTQVVLTTHSPYLLDLFEPKEVTVCIKGPQGETMTRRLSESPLVMNQRDVFTLGEIWTSEGDQVLGGHEQANAEAPLE